MVKGGDSAFDHNAAADFLGKEEEKSRAGDESKASRAAQKPFVVGQVVPQPVPTQMPPKDLVTGPGFGLDKNGMDSVVPLANPFVDGEGEGEEEQRGAREEAPGTCRRSVPRCVTRAQKSRLHTTTGRSSRRAAGGGLC
eukprot:327772-Hanusia_phi.AAC.10